MVNLKLNVVLQSFVFFVFSRLKKGAVIGFGEF